MALDDKSLSLLDIAEKSRTSIVSQLVRIGEENNQLEHGKVLYHIEELQCFQPDGLTLRRVQINAFTQREYLALSYTWDPSDHEAEQHGSYLVEKAGTNIAEPSGVRDCVIGRVLRYMHHVRIPLLWIDRHSINQDTCKDDDDCELHSWCIEKREAVEAMDIVYERSRHPVGLLARPLEDQNELHLLGRVLCGHFVDDQCRLIDTIGSAKRALHVLYEITRDRWWTRAWTFQENYRGGHRMQLLIPHHQSLERSKRGNEVFGRVPGELCISSVRLFEQATQLCIALQNWTSRWPPRVECEIQHVLWAAGRYKVLLPNSASMTPATVADIEARGMWKPWDRLAIVANCCRYSMRFNSAKLKKQDQSLSLSMLAMCLLNGEILDNRRRRKPLSASRMKPSEFLDEFMYRDFKAPRDEKKKLTFNKSCRLANVELTQDGIQTSGHLWKLGPIINANEIAWEERPFCDPQGRLEPDQRQCLFQLKRYLRAKKWSELGSQLERFLANDARAEPGAAFKSFSEYYIHLMANEVAAAIQGGGKLRLGSIYGEATNRRSRLPVYRAIFVLNSERDDEAQELPAFVFTLMQEGDPGSETHDNNDLERHVSLGVVKEASADDELPRLRTQRWLLGMCFFARCPRTEVVFPWPRALCEMPIR